MTLGMLRSLNPRTIAIFGLLGALGPLLIPVLRTLDIQSPLYPPLYVVIAALCPAWLLGPLEYGYGVAIAWLIILVANVVIWAVFGLVIAIASAMRVELVTYPILLAIGAYHAYWASGSLLAVSGLVLVVMAAYIAANRQGNANRA